MRKAILPRRLRQYISSQHLDYIRNKKPAWLAGLEWDISYRRFYYFFISFISFPTAPLVYDIQGARQMDILGMELAPNGEGAGLVSFKAHSLGFSRLKYFFDPIGVNGKSFADGRFVHYLDLDCRPFLDSQRFRFIENIKSANVLD